IAKDKLELVMDMESDRMGNLLFDEKVIAKERQVVMEERHMRIDNAPEAQLAEQMKAALFQNYPYGTPVIGWKHEIEGLTLADARRFYLSHYAPNHAVLVISGDIDTKTIRPLIARYY